MKTIFSDAEKIKNFDELSKLFYEKNFCHMSKTDLDLLMFKFYYDKVMEASTDNNGIIDYSKCSDYKISKELGITQQRVRSLKVRKELIYPNESYNWKNQLASLVHNAKYDEGTRKIIITVRDPNLMAEIRNYIEELGGYDETQLNSKILQIRVEFYIELALLLGEKEENQDAIVKKLKKHVKEMTDVDITPTDVKDTIKTAVEMTTDIATLISNIVDMFSPENKLIKALNGLINHKS